MSETPFGWAERVSRPPEQYFDAGALLHERIPAFRSAAWSVTYEQLALVAQVAGDSATHESVRLLFNLAVNDFRDLLHDLGSGSGRSAMRAARAVMEHAINLHTVAGSLAEASRYMEHLDQGPAVLRDLAPGIERLSRRDRSAYQHALKRVGAAARDRFTRSAAVHGTWFERGWTQSNLRDRAATHGIEHLYGYYKLASLVTHGSAGGALGSIRDHPGGFRIFRTGPALELSPVAFWAGIAGYREVLAALQKVRSDIDLSAYSGALDELDSLWGAYFRAISDIDRRLWPDERVRPPGAVLAFTQTKARRWYLHLPMAASLIPADAPDLPDWVEEQVAGLIDLVVANQPHMFRSDQRWLTAHLDHVTVSPTPNARPIPDTALMEFPSEDWEIRTLGTVGDG